MGEARKDSMPHPFRFSVRLPQFTENVAEWRATLRRIEDLGFHSVAFNDHFTEGSVYEPFVAMMAAADATTRLRVLCLVAGNDYRHPVMLHRMAAMIDVLSGGRLELGMGAGWSLADYQAAGLRYDPAQVRMDRLEEAVRIVKGLFGPDPFTYQGAHYQVSALDGLPKPVQRPHPPLLIGGGNPRVLALAGREADIVGLAPVNRARGVTPAQSVAKMSPEGVQTRVGWARAAATAAGHSADELEFQTIIGLHMLTQTATAASAVIEQVAGRSGTEPALLRQLPMMLVGTLDQCVETLQERRERFGLSYYTLPDPEAAAPLVGRLAGT